MGWAWAVPTVILPSCGPGLFCFIGSQQLVLTVQPSPWKVQSWAPSDYFASNTWWNGVVGQFESCHSSLGLSDFFFTFYPVRFLCQAPSPNVPIHCSDMVLVKSALKISFPRACGTLLSSTIYNSLLAEGGFTNILAWTKLFEARWQFMKMEYMKILEPCTFHNLPTKHIRYSNIVFTW